MGNKYSSQIATLSQLDPIPMGNLTALSSEYREVRSKIFGILLSVSGVTSAVSSSTIIWMIMRSHQGLSTTQHRLLLGLCVSDLISSLSMSTFNVPVPSEMDYSVWNAKGNEATCNAQGFLVTLGAFGGLYYNAALNLYYLSKVNFEKSDDYIRVKIEPFLHAVPIVGSLLASTICMLHGHFNGGGVEVICVSPVYYPMHCHGYDVGDVRPGDFEIPCGRGLEDVLASIYSRAVILFIPAVTIVISLGFIYRAVRKQEKKVAGYGRGSLHPHTDLGQSSVRNIVAHQDRDSGQESRSLLGSVRTSLVQSWSSFVSTRTRNSLTRPNNAYLNSRAVMYKAFGYSFAWILSYGVYSVLLAVELSFIKYSPTLIYISMIFVPLQGFFNFVIYLYPKVINAKRSRRRSCVKTITWCQAIRRAFWSRGNGGRRRANRRGAISKLRSSHRRNSNSRRHQRNIEPYS